MLCYSCYHSSFIPPHSSLQIRRDASITLESRQHAKILTHAHQVGLREERINLIHSQIRCKATKKIEVLRSKIEENKIVEKKLRRLMIDKPFTEAEHEYFAKLLSNKLKKYSSKTR